MTRVLAAISGHGYGHAMQTCLVLNALHRRQPGLKVHIRSQVAESFLSSRLHCDFSLETVADDFGMHMHSPVVVDSAASCAQYAAFHCDWDARVAALAAHLRALAPTILLADVPYLPLAAAAQANIPAVALCSLHWGDIYRHYCADAATAIQAQILAAYHSAQVFLQATPHMPMPDLVNTEVIGPLARLGVKRDLRQALGLGADTRVVIVGLGGIPMQTPLQQWPQSPDLVWLVPDNWAIPRADIFPFRALPWDFIDVLASADALVTKPGYGSFTEAACNGIPVLYLSRHDWPESIYLQTWLHQHAPCAEISHAQFERGDVGAALEDLWRQPAPPPPLANGAEQAADWLAQLNL
jgi:hypothetical protein